MPEEKKLGERAGTKTLDYIALGLLLAPPTVVVDMYLKGDHSINWQKTAITAVICWVAGALVVLASHGWQSWRSTDGRVWPYLIAAENKFWVKGLIVAASMGFALALSSILSNKGDNPPVSPIAATPPTAEDIAKAIAPIQAKLDAANRQLQSRLDVTERQLTETKRQLNAVQQTPLFAPTPTNQGPIIWHVLLASPRSIR
jgi:hypothetical protein